MHNHLKCRSNQAPLSTNCRNPSVIYTVFPECQLWAQPWPQSPHFSLEVQSSFYLLLSSISCHSNLHPTNPTPKIQQGVLSLQIHLMLMKALNILLFLCLIFFYFLLKVSFLDLRIQIFKHPSNGNKIKTVGSHRGIAILLLLTTAIAIFMSLTFKYGQDMQMLIQVFLFLHKSFPGSQAQ